MCTGLDWVLNSIATTRVRRTSNSSERMKRSSLNKMRTFQKSFKNVFDRRVSRTGVRMMTQLCWDINICKPQKQLPLKWHCIAVFSEHFFTKEVVTVLRGCLSVLAEKSGVLFIVRALLCIWPPWYFIKMVHVYLFFKILLIFFNTTYFQKIQ